MDSEIKTIIKITTRTEALEPHKIIRETKEATAEVSGTIHPITEIIQTADSETIPQTTTTPTTADSAETPRTTASKTSLQEAGADLDKTIINKRTNS